MRPPCKILWLSGPLFALILLSILVVHAQSGSMLSGIIKTKRGYPVPSARVTLASDDRVQQMRTGEKGVFEFGNLPPSTYVLEVSFWGLAPARVPGIQLPDHGVTNLPITLKPWLEDIPAWNAAHECNLVSEAFVDDTIEQISYEERHANLSLTGAVEFELRPLSQATVTLLRAGESSPAYPPELSDEKGEYAFRDIGPGKYRVKMSRDGFSSGTSGDFWIARQNTTRLGHIRMYHPFNDNCGMFREAPLDDPVPAPWPDLIDPTAKPPTGREP